TVEIQNQHISCQRHLAKPFVDDAAMKCSRLARASSCVNMMIGRMGKRWNRNDNRTRKRGPEMGNCCPQIGHFLECRGQRFFVTTQKGLERRAQYVLNSPEQHQRVRISLAATRLPICAELMQLVESKHADGRRCA